MSFVCPECGSMIEEDADFCYRCGCKRSKATVHINDGIGLSTCPRCGAEVHEGELFCRSCGSPLSVSYPLKASKDSTVAMFLALIPGFFSIYGLGHLMLKEWVRGAMFLAMTALYWYMRSSTGNTLLLVVLSIGLFIYQAIDLARIIMIRSLGNG